MDLALNNLQRLICHKPKQISQKEKNDATISPTSSHKTLLVVSIPNLFLLLLEQ